MLRFDWDEGKNGLIATSMESVFAGLREGQEEVIDAMGGVTAGTEAVSTPGGASPAPTISRRVPR